MERCDNVVLEPELSQVKQQQLKCRGEWVFVEKEKQQAKKDFENLKELEKEGAKLLHERLWTNGFTTGIWFLIRLS